MTEYIDKGKLYKAIVDREEEYRSPLLRERNYNTPTALQMKGLLNATTLIKHLVFDFPAADVVEVVRCQDCKYLGIKDFVYGYCENPCGLHGIVRPESYCSRGERKRSEG